MALPLTLDATEPLDGSMVVGEEEFVLDMKVVESTTPLVTMMCSTSDGCGSTCSTSACSTSSNDPF
ncbi:FxLD family lantipeptide [Actinomadura craniellae]|uniref:FxLD family lantipeptide n=1 Tax=Actinomadura craniellae TaxID=2231787 RepID=A0A365HAY3_9ACTN|nr:FxLD family lanthipeptide [Actinomadura craniellae]RAY15423.1 FxLD family lantipeptide [Actinomadura craniellae]